MLNTMKSPVLALAAVLTCFWAFGAIHAHAADVALTKEAQAAITPAKALEMLKQGNERFVSSKLKKRDLMSQVKKTSKGQFPFAAIVSCLDSRTQPEFLFDQGIGDIFVARVAGNFVNDDILGSLEFATKLGSLQPFLAVFIIVTFFLGLGLLFFFITRHLTDYQMRRSHNDIVGYIFTTIGAIYGVLLAFLTVIVWQNYIDAATNAAKEATAALTVYRDLGLYPEQDQAKEIVPELLAYLEAVVNEEFPAMAENKKSLVAMGAMTRLWAKFHTLTPRTYQEQVIFQEILKNLNVMAQLRFERLMLAFNPKLSSLMRNILMIGAIITIACAICLGAENFWWHIFLTTLLITLIAAILFAVLELANPFSGGIAIQPDDYVEVLKLMETK